MQKSRKKIILHVCCATCGAYVSTLLSKDYEVVLYYSNSNIYSEEEFIRRKNDVEKIARNYTLEMYEDKYNHKAWLEFIKGLETEPEKGKRCLKCYEYRMKNLVNKAIDLGIDNFATTLSVSPHKIYKYIKSIGQRLEKETGLKYYDQDFKKQDGYKKSNDLSREMNFYRQNYCGCEFSKR